MRCDAGRFGESLPAFPMYDIVGIFEGLFIVVPPHRSVTESQQFAASMSVERVHFERSKTNRPPKPPERASEGGTKMATATGDVNVKPSSDT